MSQGERPIVLSKGGNVDLRSVQAELGKLNVILRVADSSAGEAIDADISLLLVGANGTVLDNDCFVFYNQPVAFGGAVHLRESRRDPAAVVGTVTVSLDDLPDDVQRVVVVGSLDGSSGRSFAESGGIFVGIEDADAQPLVQFEVTDLGSERALLFGEFYRRSDSWKFRAIAQGYAAGLGAVAEHFGVEVQAEDEAQSETADPEASEGESSDVHDPAASPEPVSAVQAEGVSVRRSQRPPRLPKDWNRLMPTGEGDYQVARLFPVAGIGAGEEQERRATSAFLAVLAMVKPFSRVLLSSLGAPAGTPSTYTEVPFSHKEEAYRPDGLIVVQRGQRTWQALVEVKTGKSELTAQQVETYVDIARAQGFDAVITLSNQLPISEGEHPLSVDRRKLRKISLLHLSWDEVRSAASTALRGEFPDPTQRLVLAEFLRYMEHERSGLHGFTDMGKRWTQVRESAKTGTLRLTDAGTTEIVDRFDQLMVHVALELTNALGVRARTCVPDDAPDQTSRRQQLVDSGLLFGSIKVPGAVGKVVVKVDIRTDTVHATVATPAPRTGRLDTRVRWIVRQLKDASPTARVESLSVGPRADLRPALLSELREDEKTLIHPDGRDPKEFRVTYSARMGAKRASGAGTLISSVVDLVMSFYGDVVQNVAAP